MKLINMFLMSLQKETTMLSGQLSSDDHQYVI